MDITTKYKFNTLEDFLISTPLSFDGAFDDGWGANFPVKGIEIDATVLFADISGFTKHTHDMEPAEVLIFVNNFFSWITAESIMHAPCIVDKYIGDEVMLLFSKAFGSEDPFVDAVRSARWMIERDVLSFHPHIGIASGKVVAGHVGTPVKYNASLFGKPVNIASRCATVKPLDIRTSPIIFPAEEWQNRNIREVIEPITYKDAEGNVSEKYYDWELSEPRDVELKNMGNMKIHELTKSSFWISSDTSAESRAKETYQLLFKDSKASKD